jgi:hypothetical protein
MTDSSMERRLLEAQRILEIYFRNWGAAKAAEWEEITGGKPFSAENAWAAILKLNTDQPTDALTAAVQAHQRIMVEEVIPTIDADQWQQAAARAQMILDAVLKDQAPDVSVILDQPADAEVLERARKWVNESPASSSVKSSVQAREVARALLSTHAALLAAQREARQAVAFMEVAMEDERVEKARAEAAEQRLQQAKAALEPFAGQAARWDEIPGVCTWADDVELWQNGNYRCPITVGDLRHARAALRGQP